VAVPSPRFLLIVTLALLTGGASGRADISNPQANAKAREILAYIQGLSSRTDRKILSGEFTAFAPKATLALPEATYQQTGHWPAYIGVDYRNFDDGTIDSATANRVALAYWRAGGLVEVSVHLRNPLDSTRGGGLRDRNVNLSGLLVPGSPENAAWNGELDLVAAGLHELQQEGVVVLWRPFHEMNGAWFWWGKKPPEDFKRLWRYTFYYLTRSKGLDNLIWIYSPNMGPKAEDYYPGGDTVDIVGLDAYTDNVDRLHVWGYGALARLGKPFGFGEFGPHAPKDPPGDYDYRRWIPAVEQGFPLTSFFMTWNGKWSPPNNLHAREFFNDPMIVNREDLPRWRE